MAESALVIDDSVTQTARLRQFLAWLILSAISGGIVELLGYVLTGMLPLGLVSAMTLGFVGIACWAWWLVRKGAFSAAVSILCADLLAAVGIAVVIFPALLPASVVATLLAVVLGLPYLGRRALGGLTIGAGLMGVIATVLAQLPSIQQLFAPPPPLITDGVTIGAVAIVLGSTLLLLWQFSTQLRETLAQSHMANAALREARADLAGQVVERTADLQTALSEVKERSAEQARLLAEVEQQRAIIRELSVPVIPISASTLIMPLVGALDSERLRLVQEQALGALEHTYAHTLVLDVTGVPLVDSQVAHGLLAVAQATRLLGATTVLVGVRPEVAQALVGLGLCLEDMQTYRDLQSALTSRNA